MSASALHIFKPGQHTPMAGQPLNFSEADLAASARAYDPALHEAPLVVGHPRHDAPAYGWVRSLSTDSAGLHADPHQVDAAFAELVATGRFKKISASFYLPDAPNNPVPGVYYLRHVGFLGAHPPAVKGLREASFADAEEGVVEFADWGMDANATLWRRLRDWLLARFGQEAADQVVPDWQIETIREAARSEDTPRAAFADPPTHTEESVVTPEQKAALEAENAQLKERLAAAEAREQANAAQQLHQRNGEFAEQLIAQGRLMPKHRGAVVAFLDFTEADTSLCFGEGDDQQPLAQAFKGFLAELPTVVSFGEIATKDSAVPAEPTNPLLADAAARAASTKE